MALQLDLNNVDNPAKVGTGGRVNPGRCHLVLTSFEEYGETKTGSHVAKFEVLAHDDPSQIGKTFTDFLSDPANGRSEKAIAYATERILKYCYILGVTTPEAMSAAKRGGQMPNLDLTTAVGRQVFAELVEEEYDGKKNVRIGNAGFDLWSVNDPHCKAFPANAAMKARAAGKQATQQPAESTTATMPTQAKQQANPFDSVS